MSQHVNASLDRVARMREENKAQREALRYVGPSDANLLAAQKHQATMAAVRERVEANMGPPHTGSPVVEPLPPAPAWDVTLWFGQDIGLPLSILMARVVAIVGKDIAQLALDYAIARWELNRQPD